MLAVNAAVNFVIYLRFNKRFRSILAQMVFGPESASVGRRHPLLSGRPIGDSGGEAKNRIPTTDGPAMAAPSPSLSTVGALQRRSHPAGDHRLSTITTTTLTRMKSTDQTDAAAEHTTAV